MDDKHCGLESQTGEVGYRNPPVHGRFKKGESGNPNGRPKGSRNFCSIFSKAFRERVVVNEHGKRKTITKMEAATKQLANKAASGDLAALRQAIAIIALLEDKSETAVPSVPVLDDADKEVLMGLFKRIERVAKQSEDQ